MKPKPKPGKGERFLDCIHYGSCLDFAAIENWKAFNCEQCGFYIETFQKVPASGSIKQENVRICEKCGEKPTIQASSPYCASCLSLKAKESRARKKEAIKAVPIPKNGKQGGSMGLRKGKEAYLDKDQAEIGQPRAHFEIIFSEKYSQVLKEVEKLAEEEIRTVDEQIVYIIKIYLSNTQHLGDIK